MLPLSVQADAQQGAQPLLRVQVRQPDLRVHLQHLPGYVCTFTPSNNETDEIIEDAPWGALRERG